MGSGVGAKIRLFSIFQKLDEIEENLVIITPPGVLLVAYCKH